jgi:hypothetical protein
MAYYPLKCTVGVRPPVALVAHTAAIPALDGTNLERGMLCFTVPAKPVALISP